MVACDHASWLCLVRLVRHSRRGSCYQNSIEALMVIEIKTKTTAPKFIKNLYVSGARGQHRIRSRNVTVLSREPFVVGLDSILATLPKPRLSAWSGLRLSFIGDCATDDKSFPIQVDRVVQIE